MRVLYYCDGAGSLSLETLRSIGNSTGFPRRKAEILIYRSLKILPELFFENIVDCRKVSVADEEVKYEQQMKYEKFGRDLQPKFNFVSYIICIQCIFLFQFSLFQNLAKLEVWEYSFLIRIQLIWCYKENAYLFFFFKKRHLGSFHSSDLRSCSIHFVSLALLLFSMFRVAHFYCSFVCRVGMLRKPCYCWCGTAGCLAQWIVMNYKMYS